MTFTEALAKTQNTRLIARPVSGLRAGLGYYVAGGVVLWWDKTALSADLRTPLRRRADFGGLTWAVLSGEWEVVTR